MNVMDSGDETGVRCDVILRHPLQSMQYDVGRHVATCWSRPAERDVSRYGLELRDI
ncbi:hypothetical protein J6590_018714 [Homalodisca vitripennis]|nr:hypothetical protein J6590_018714 [Homalodisca vitripennis]